MTSPSPGDQVFDLLPAVYRERDSRPDGQAGFLQSLLSVIADQLAIVDADIGQLYDDLFIETCAAWVVPYIGDLVAVTPGAPNQSGAVLARAAVADAIALRRRKGTAAVLEQLARDITGWPALALEMFQRLAVTQHLQHVVPARGCTVSVRSALSLERIGTSFDSAAHTAEIRRIGSARGKYNVQNVAVMVWRDAPLPRTWVDAAGVDSRRFRFNPLGCDQALMTQPQTEVTLAHQASSLNVPGPVTRRAMAALPGAYYGPGLSVAVRRAGQPDPVDVSDSVVCDLSDAVPGGATWFERVPARAIAGGHRPATGAPGVRGRAGLPAAGQLRSHRSGRCRWYRAVRSPGRPQRAARRPRPARRDWRGADVGRGRADRGRRRGDGRDRRQPHLPR